MILHRTEKLREAGAETVVWKHGRRNFSLMEQGVAPIILLI